MLRNAASKIVHACHRRPWLVLLLCLGAAALAGFGASRTLSINTDLDALFNRDLPFRFAEKEFDNQFPDEVDLIVAVVDGPSPAAAARAAQRLVTTLAPRDDLFYSVTSPGGGPFFEQNGLLYLSVDELNDLSTKIAVAQPLLGAIASDRNARGLFRLLDLGFQGAAQGSSGAEGIAPVVNSASEVIASTLEGHAKPIDWMGLFGAMSPPNQSARAMVLARPRLDLTAIEQGGAAETVIRESAQVLGLTPDKGYRVRLTGQVPLADEEFATVAEGTGIAGVVSVVLVTLLLWIALGSGRVVLAAVVMLTVGLFLTFGWAALTVHEINLISIAFAVMFVGIAVDFVIQFCMRYRAERWIRSGQHANSAALDAAGVAMARPLLLAAAATALGFFSFLPTQYRGVAQLGVIAGGGMIVAVILSFTLLPALLSILRPPPERDDIGFAWAEPINRRLLARRAPVLIGCGILALLALAVVPRLVFDFDPLKLKDPATESMSTALELMDDPLVNPNTLDVLVKTPEQAKALSEKLAALPEVRQALTIFDLVPDDQDTKLSMIHDLSDLLEPVMDPELTREPKAPVSAQEIKLAAQTAGASARAYLASGHASGELKDATEKFLPLVDKVAGTDYWTIMILSAAMLRGFDEAIEPLRLALNAEKVAIDALPPDLRATYISRDGRYRVQAFPAGKGADAESLKQFLTAVRTVAPDAIGAPVVIYETGRIVTRAFAVAAILALITITILLFAVVRRPDDVARVLIPLLFAGLLTLGTCALIRFPLNFANIIALPLLLGVGVTFPIYFVSAWREGEGLLLSSPTGRGMVFSALTTSAAFGSLALSKHVGTAAMGELLAMALAYTLFATLVLLPALLGPAPKSPSEELPPS